jgi:hypothetical protein
VVVVVVVAGGLGMRGVRVDGWEVVEVSGGVNGRGCGCERGGSGGVVGRG